MAPTSQDSTPKISGFLLVKRQKGLAKRWKRRFVTVDETQLAIYRNDQEFVPKYAYSLDQLRIERSNKDSTRKKRFKFYVHVMPSSLSSSTMPHTIGSPPSHSSATVGSTIASSNTAPSTNTTAAAAAACLASPPPPPPPSQTLTGGTTKLQDLHISEEQKKVKFACETGEERDRWLQIIEETISSRKDQNLHAAQSQSQPSQFVTPEKRSASRTVSLSSSSNEVPSTDPVFRSPVNTLLLHSTRSALESEFSSTSKRITDRDVERIIDKTRLELRNIVATLFPGQEQDTFTRDDARKIIDTFAEGTSELVTSTLAFHELLPESQSSCHFDDILELVLTKVVPKLVKRATESRRNVLVMGGEKSGKTSLVKAFKNPRAASPPKTQQEKTSENLGISDEIVTWKDLGLILWDFADNLNDANSLRHFLAKKRAAEISALIWVVDASLIDQTTLTPRSSTSMTSRTGSQSPPPPMLLAPSPNAVDTRLRESKRALKKILKNHRKQLGHRPVLVLVNKIDLLPQQQQPAVDAPVSANLDQICGLVAKNLKLEKYFGRDHVEYKVVPVSTVSRQGLVDALDWLHAKLK